MPGVMGQMGMMGMSGRPGSTHSGIVRYPQLLGWKTNLLPLRISIGRRGKWFRWSIANRQITAYPENPETQHFQDLATGETPELPTGLRRFWKKSELSSPVPANAKEVDATQLPDPEVTPPKPFDPELFRENQS